MHDHLIHALILAAMAVCTTLSGLFCLRAKRHAASARRLRFVAAELVGSANLHRAAAAGAARRAADSAEDADQQATRALAALRRCERLVIAEAAAAVAGPEDAPTAETEVPRLTLAEVDYCPLGPDHC